MRNFRTYLFVIATLLLGCKKDQLPEIPPSNDPIFSITGEIDGNPFELIAGQSQTIMENAIETKNNVDYYTSKLSNASEEIHFSLADGELDKPSKEWGIEGSDFFTLLPFYEQPLYSMNVFSFSNSQLITGVSWEVNGEAITGEKIDFSAPGLYEVCGNFTFLGGASANLCNDLLIGFNRAEEIALTFDLIEPAVYRLELDAGDSPISQVNWFVNDSLFSTEESPLLMLSVVNNNVRCEFESEGGVSRKREIYLNRDNEEAYVEDFGHFEKNSDGFADFKAELLLNMSFGSFKAIPYQDVNSISVKEVTLYEETDKDLIYLVKTVFEGKVLNLNNEEIVDAQINFNFALPISK